MLTEDRAMQLLGWAVQEFAGHERRDIASRVALIQQHLQNGQFPQPEVLNCMDLLVPPDERDPLLQMLARCAPQCMGDTHVDFRKFDSPNGLGANRYQVFTRVKVLSQWNVRTLPNHLPGNAALRAMAGILDAGQSA